MLEKYKRDLNEVLTYKYILIVAAVLLIGYGFAMTNPTMDIDDVRTDYYYGEGQVMLRSGRFGMTLWAFVFQLQEFVPCIDSVIGVILIAAAAVNFTILFFRSSGQEYKESSAILFSGIFVSYPLINELWNYYLGPLFIAGGYLLCAVALLLIREKSRISIAIAAVLLIPVVAGYESLTAVYVLGTFCVLLLEAVGQNRYARFRDLVKSGLVYLSVLLAALAMKALIARIILKILDEGKMSNGDNAIHWLTQGWSTTWRELIQQLLYYDGILGIWYPPIAVLLIAEVIFIIMIIVMLRYRKSATVIWCSVGILLSLYLLPLLQGYFVGYRTCQTYALFVSFVFSVSIYILDLGKRRLCIITRQIAATALVFLTLFQSITLCKYFILNYERSEEELEVVRNVGYELTQINDEGKPVLFVGEYSIRSEITDQISIQREGWRWELTRTLYLMVYGDTDVPTEYVHTNINSVLTWAMWLTSTGETEMRDIFRYCGYDYPLIYEEKLDNYGFFLLNDEENKELQQIFAAATAFAEENMSLYPSEGYIYEGEDYIIVNLSNQ